MIPIHHDICHGSEKPAHKKTGPQPQPQPQPKFRKIKKEKLPKSFIDGPKNGPEILNRGDH